MLNDKKAKKQYGNNFQYSVHFELRKQINKETI